MKFIKEGEYKSSSENQGQGKLQVQRGEGRELQKEKQEKVVHTRVSMLGEKR